MRPIDEWDEGYVLAEIEDIKKAPETEVFERKASAAPFDREKMAKEICAFANAGDGMIVYGALDAKDGGGIDAGVEAMNGRQPIQSWVEQQIPGFHHPPIETCKVRFIPMTNKLGTGRGVLAIEVPLSDRRPHWSRLGKVETAYLRVGEHSAPMRLQTLLDISSRGTAPFGEIGDFELHPWTGLDLDESTFRKTKFNGVILTPSVRVAGGPICSTWGLEMVLTSSVSEQDNFMSSVRSTAKVDRGNGFVSIFRLGEQVLFPGRWTRTPTETLILEPVDAQRNLRVTLFLESAIPIHRDWKISQISGCFRFDPQGFSRSAPIS